MGCSQKSKAVAQSAPASHSPSARQKVMIKYAFNARAVRWLSHRSMREHKTKRKKNHQLCAHGPRHKAIQATSPLGEFDIMLNKRHVSKHK